MFSKIINLLETALGSVAAAGLPHRLTGPRAPVLVSGHRIRRDTSMTDPRALLIRRIAKGDRAALGALYSDLEKPVYRFILSRLNDPHSAADLLQDVFIDVWKGAARFEGRSKVQTWIFGIAHRKVIDHMRKHGRVDVTDSLPDTPDDSPDMEACLTATEEAGHVAACLGELSDGHRSVVSLVFYEDMSAPEVSAATGVPEGTVRSRLHHAKKLLLRCLQGRMERSPA